MAALLDNQEQALLRGWMNRLGWPLLGQLYLDGADTVEVRQKTQALRQRLALKAQHLGLPELASFWLNERLDGEAWIKQAEAGLTTLLDTPDPLPSLGDGVARWFPQPIAGKLQAHGLDTLQALVAFRQRLGNLWWQSVPKLGSHSAKTVGRLLKIHATSLGLAGNALATRPLVPAAANKVKNPAMENLFDAQAELNGFNGTNRASHDRCRIPAGNDFEAIHTWLDLRDHDSHTYRNYRKESERFLLWAVTERGKALSSLDTADCKDYRDFLFAPAEAWLNPKFKPRWSPSWRPFKGPLQHRTVKHTETILSSMCEWLVKQRYLDNNPFDGLPPMPSQELHSLQVEHALDETQWQWLLEYCAKREASHPDGERNRHYRRLWIALQLAYCTGLRLAELANARFGDIAYKSRNDGQHWLRVLGKGSKRREVPLPPELADELKRYAQERGTVWGVPDSPEPIIGKFRKTAVFGETDFDMVETPFTTSGLHRVLKGFFNEAAGAMSRSVAEEDKRNVETLTNMTTHWLRHTHASHALGRGAALISVKENLGHASLATTSLYLHGDKDQRYAEMGKLFRKRTG
ncbi:MAG: tyrosine-type recombinase/integrase [Proteobacteria bacterium]|nr:tyrosine-type recombinase/integrase [Pseudomonadota bacterium]